MPKFVMTLLLVLVLGFGITQSQTINTTPCDWCGDANVDDAVNLLDILFVIDYLYGNPSGAAPDPMEYADVNADTAVNLLDILAIIDHLYGNPPNVILTCLVKDIDNNYYRTIKIGDQCWMADNLMVTHYNNGDPIPNVTDNTEWSNLDSGAYCSFDNNEENVSIYGRLYNWYAAVDSRKVAPVGWHVPSDEEWMQLESYLGMSESVLYNQNSWRGTDEGGKLKDTILWVDPNTGATNESGFSALPGGQRYTTGEFPDVGLGHHSIFYTSSINGISPWYRYLDHELTTIYRMCGYARIGGMSIRCVKNVEDSLSGTVTDIDGNEYQTIKIGDQWWMMENLKVTHYRNGDPIPNVIDNGQWSGLSSGAYCHYDNNEGNVAVYGQLYNWYAVDDSRNIAPEGWHVPTDEEWKQLEMFLGMTAVEADAEDWRGTDEGGKLKDTGTIFWLLPNTGATNESGFTALPGGYRMHDGSYNSKGGNADLWTSSESASGSAWIRGLDNDNAYICRNTFDKRDGWSIRCVKD